MIETLWVTKVHTGWAVQNARTEKIITFNSDREHALESAAMLASELEAEVVIQNEDGTIDYAYGFHEASEHVEPIAA
ncbi:MAG: DUF2188 domain-containing protein [Opitutales bacterium]